MWLDLTNIAQIHYSELWVGQSMTPIESRCIMAFPSLDVTLVNYLFTLIRALVSLTTIHINKLCLWGCHNYLVFCWFWIDLLVCVYNIHFLMSLVQVQPTVYLHHTGHWIFCSVSGNDEFCQSEELKNNVYDTVARFLSEERLCWISKGEVIMNGTLYYIKHITPSLSWTLDYL